MSVLFLAISRICLVIVLTLACTAHAAVMSNSPLLSDQGAGLVADDTIEDHANDCDLVFGTHTYKEHLAPRLAAMPYIEQAMFIYAVSIFNPPQMFS